MKINISKLARDIIGGGEMSVEQVLEKLHGMGVDTNRRKLFDIMKSQVESKIMNRRDVAGVLMYSAGRDLKTDSMEFTQKPIDKPLYTREQVEAIRVSLLTEQSTMAAAIRKAVKILPMYPLDIAHATGYRKKLVYASLSSIAESGFIKKMADGRYAFVCEPVGRVYKKSAKAILRDMSVSSKRQNEDAGKWQGEPETIEQFLARGGKIDYSDTLSKFERLTHEEIVSKVGVVSIGYQSPISARLSPSGRA